jgi:hypothetical protein
VTAGRWRVALETADGGALSTLAFRIDDDEGQEEGTWRSIR